MDRLYEVLNAAVTFFPLQVFIAMSLFAFRFPRRSLFFLHTSWPYCCYRLRFRFCNYSFVLLTISETNIFAILFYLIF